MPSTNLVIYILVCGPIVSPKTYSGEEYMDLFLDLPSIDQIKRTFGTCLLLPPTLSEENYNKLISEKTVQIKSTTYSLIEHLCADYNLITPKTTTDGDTTNT